MTKGGVNSNVHHCCECKQPVRARCIRLGHVAPCEDPSCKAFFQVYKGCSLHPYSEGYNLETLKKQKGRKRSRSADEDEADDDNSNKRDEPGITIQISQDTDPNKENNEGTTRNTLEDPEKSKSVTEREELMAVPKGGWNQAGLALQPNGQKRRDKKSMHVAAKANQRKQKCKMQRRAK